MARGSAETTVRHMPEPLRAGHCVGFDPEAVVPKNESGAGEWVMLLAVDFTSGKVRARDTDCGKVAAGEP